MAIFGTVYLNLASHPAAAQSAFTTVPLAFAVLSLVAAALIRWAVRPAPAEPKPLATVGS